MDARRILAEAGLRLSTMLNQAFCGITSNILFITVFLPVLSCNFGGEEYQRRITAQLLASSSIQLIQDSSITVINHSEAEIMPYNDVNSKIKDICYIPFYSKNPIGGIDKLIIYCIFRICAIRSINLSMIQLSLLNM